MASGGNMKGFYRQRKKATAGGITTKPSPSKVTKSNRKSPQNSATLGSNAVHSPSLITHGSLDLQDDYDKNEEILRQFDLNMAYGPCIGMTRQARWDRAISLGLNPPKEVGHLLTTGNVNAECLWDGRV